MKVKKGDFIEIDFVGRIKETNEIFDLTSEEEAKKNNVYNEKANYKPITICIGEGDVVRGLDKALEGKEVGKEYKIKVESENAFGKKNAKLMKLVPSNVFRKENINPIPGLQVNIDGLIGTIRTVSGGRILIDFNHWLAGKDLLYKIRINKIIKEDREKLKRLLEFHLGKEIKIRFEKEKAVIEEKIPDILERRMLDKIHKLIPSIKSIEFKTSNKT